MSGKLILLKLAFGMFTLLIHGECCVSSKKSNLHNYYVHVEGAPTSRYTYVGVARDLSFSEISTEDFTTLSLGGQVACSFAFIDVVLTGMKSYFFPISPNDQESYSPAYNVLCAPQNGTTVPVLASTVTTRTLNKNGFKKESWTTYSSPRQFFLDENNYDLVFAQLHFADILKQFVQPSKRNLSLSMASFVNELYYVQLDLNTFIPSDFFFSALSGLEEKTKNRWVHYHQILNTFGSEVLQSANIGHKISFVCLHSSEFSFSQSSNMIIDEEMTLEQVYRSWLGRIEGPIEGSSFVLEGGTLPPTLKLGHILQQPLKPVILAYRGIRIDDPQIIGEMHHDGMAKAIQYDRIQQGFKKMELALIYQFGDNELRDAVLHAVQIERRRLQPRKELLSFAESVVSGTMTDYHTIKCVDTPVKHNATTAIRVHHSFTLYPFICTTDPSIQSCEEWERSARREFACLQLFKKPECKGNYDIFNDSGLHGPFLNFTGVTSFALCQ